MNMKKDEMYVKRTISGTIAEIGICLGIMIFVLKVIQLVLT